MGRSRSPVTLGPWPGLAAWILLVLGGLVGLSVRGDEPLADRRARVESLSPAEKEELARRQERFSQLDAAEQKRLRELARKLAADEHSQQLRQIMHRYYQWVTTLPPYERSALVELPPSERIGRIRELLEEQARKAKRPRPAATPAMDRARRWLLEFGGPVSAVAKRSTEEDLKSLQPWLEQYLLRHESTIVERLPQAKQKKARELLALKNAERRKTALATAWLQLQLQHPPAPVSVTEKEAASLHDQLAPEFRQRLGEIPQAEVQRRVILLWLRLAALYQVLQHPEPSLPLVEEDELARYFDEKLDLMERDRLLGLPAEEMQRELLLSYLRSRLDERPRPAGKREANSSPRPGRPAPAAAGKK